MGIFEKRKPDFKRVEMNDMPPAPRPLNPVAPQVVGEPPIVNEVPSIPSAPIQPQPVMRETVTPPVDYIPQPTYQNPQPVVEQKVVEVPIQQPTQQVAEVPTQQPPQEYEQQEVVREVQVPVVISEKDLARETFNAILRLESRIAKLEESLLE